MLYKFFTLRYDEDSGNFDDDEFQEFIADKEVVSVTRPQEKKNVFFFRQPFS